MNYSINYSTVSIYLLLCVGPYTPYDNKSGPSQGAPPVGFAPTSHFPQAGPGLEDDQAPKEFMFSDETIRKGFIRKVYSILSVSDSQAAIGC